MHVMETFLRPAYLFSVYVLIVACICVSHACSDHGGQERALDPMEVELVVTMGTQVLFLEK